MRTPCQAVAEHANWVQWSLKDKRAYLETKGYRYSITHGTLCRSMSFDEYARNGWTGFRHRVRWEFDNTLDRRRAVDDCGRVCIDWQYITTT